MPVRTIEIWDAIASRAVEVEAHLVDAQAGADMSYGESPSQAWYKRARSAVNAVYASSKVRQ